MNSINPSKNYDYSVYFMDPASPFMRAIIDLHDYVFMFLTGILIFVFYIMYIIWRDSKLLTSRMHKVDWSYYAPSYRVTYEWLFAYKKIGVLNYIRYIVLFFCIYLFIVFLFLHMFKNIYSKLSILYYDLFVGPRIFYVYEFLNKAHLEQGAKTRKMFGTVVMGFFKFFIDLRTESELIRIVGLKERLAQEDVNLAITIPAYLYLNTFITIWLLVGRYSSSFTQFYFFSNFVLKYQATEGRYLEKFFKGIYAHQFRISTINSYKFVHNDVLETLWTVLPSFILVLITIPSLLVLFAIDEVGKPVLTVKAIGHQWYWSYEVTYTSPETNETKTWNFDSYMTAAADLNVGQHRNLEVDNTLYLPVNTHVRVLATSMDVIHSWAVPALGIKIDAIPGRLNQAGLFIDRLGTFYGQCSEICGTNHGFMPIRIHVFANFNLWLTKFFSAVE